MGKRFLPMPVRNTDCSGVSTRIQTRWQSMLQFSGIPEPGDFDRILSECELLMVQRMPDRRPFRALIECVQNLQRHSAPDSPIEFRLLGRCVEGEPRFLIRTVNTLLHADVDRVKLWLQRHERWQRDMNRMAKEGHRKWRELHRDMLESSERTPRGGAGLGWVSIARFAKGTPSIRMIADRDVHRLFFSVEVACGG